MHVVIRVPENMIYIDGKGRALNCSGLRSRQIATIRWDGKRGEIEYVGRARPAFAISKLEAFQPDGFTVRGLIDAAKALE